uniref:Sushi domain-containing protein n=1 Tax=Chelydra serpentina TaxID=8475 RepID=A0A8C3RJ28_CHESE
MSTNTLSLSCPEVLQLQESWARLQLPGGVTLKALAGKGQIFSSFAPSGCWVPLRASVGFPINTQVTYRCLDGFVKIPGKSDTVECLSNSQWSNMEEFCGRSCLAPPRLKSAVLSDEDLRKNYYPVGTTVSYVCRPAYEKTELSPVITCLENLTWMEAPEFCLGKSCGVPKSPEHSRPVDTTNNRFGAKIMDKCLLNIFNSPLTEMCISCAYMMPFSFPAVITCSPPPNITNGMHNGSNVEIFGYNSSITYKCDHNFSLTGEASIQCTTKDNINGVWNGSAPECKEKNVAGGSGYMSSGHQTSLPPSLLESNLFRALSACFPCLLRKAAQLTITVHLQRTPSH